MGKLESWIVLIGLGVLVAVAAAVVYAVGLLGAERLNVYVMVLLIILGVAVFMRGLRVDHRRQPPAPAQQGGEGDGARGADS